jgi:DNA polymerase-3 subunit delta'
MELSGLPPVSAPLPWQRELWGQLEQQLEGGQLPHALLLSGPPDIGKRRLALALARKLLCHEPVDGMNCGQCHACHLSAGGTHGDLCWLEPEEKSRVIKIDQVRAVVEFANKTANFGRRKVIVLAPADSMNNNAANALLKSLEEPAAETYLILACNRLQGVPATIRSRCQIRKLATPAPGAALDWLDLTTGDRALSEQLLTMAEGRPMLAESLHLSGGAAQLSALRQALHGLMSGQGGIAEVGALLSDLDIEELLTRIDEELRCLIRGFPPEGLSGARGRAAFGVLDEVLTIQRAVAGGANPNRQLLVEALLAKMQRELGAGG